MIEFCKSLFSSDGFLPQGYCYLWRPGVVWLHVVSDALIALAYYSIPLTLAYFVRKRKDLGLHWMFVCFAVFIVACGTTHLMEIWNVWQPTYWLSGGIKALTAAASVPTAILLRKVVPRALALPSPSALRNANNRLQREIAERGLAGAQFDKLNEALEHRVHERTAELRESNRALQEEVAEHKRVEEALRASEERFRHMVEVVKDYAIFMLDVEGRVVTWNIGAQRMKGYSSQEILGCHFSRFYEPHDVESGKPARGLKQAAAAGRFEAEGWRVRKDGSRFWANVVITALEDGAGKLQGFVKVTRDMTERKQAEEALRASEERFRRYFELGLIGMAITSPAKGYLEANDELGRFLGYGRDELLQRTWADLTHPDDLAADVAQFNRVMAGEMDGYTLDKRWIRKDGEILDSITAARCVRSSDGSVDYFVALVLDTTGRKRAEAALRRSEANLADAQRLSHTGSWAWNVATGEFFWSMEHFRLFGLEPEHFKPTIENTRRWIHSEDRPLVERTLARAIRRRTDFEVEYRIVRPDGSTRYHRGLGHPVVKEGGELEFIGTVMDVTESKRAEEDLQKLQTELAHVMRVTMLGELAGSIAHEVNQPLGAIVNNGNVCLRLLNGPPEAREEMREALGDIVNDATRAGAIIARIRALTKRAPFEKTSLRLRDLVDDVLALARRELAARRVTVRLELTGDLPRVTGDRVQLEQVLLNLVMNASEAMGEIPSERRILTIRAEPDELAGQPAVLMAVQDLGCGFRGEDAERLFDAFFSTKAQGMGMGLRISRSIVEAHGGRLWAKANPGPGATFLCALPAENQN